MSPLLRWCFTLFTLTIAACGGQQATSAGAASPASQPANDARHGGPWKTTALTNHPLVGRIFEVGKGFVDEATLVERAAGARHLLLGEKHDNPDHHRLQASLLKAVVDRGKRPLLAFEMFEIDEQEALDAYLTAHPRDAAGLGPALGWEKKGWPAWRTYQPIAEVGLTAGLLLRGANLPRAEARAVVRKGVAALGSERIKALGLSSGLAPSLEASLSEELRQSHCGHLPEEVVMGMVHAQRARDATMASVLRDHGEGRGSVLIAGFGHARLDRGVPLYLGKGEGVVSVAFLEVSAGVAEPAGYAEMMLTDHLPFTFVWFTPRASTKDPCEAFGKPSGVQAAGLMGGAVL